MKIIYSAKTFFRRQKLFFASPVFTTCGKPFFQRLAKTCQPCSAV